MRVPVLFKQITKDEYLNLTPKISSTFYLVMTGNDYDLYLGEQKLNNLQEIVDEINNLAKVSITGAAIDVSIEDATNLYVSTDVEGALAEIMREINDLKHVVDVNVDGTALEFSDENGLPVLIDVSDTDDVMLLAG